MGVITRTHIRRRKGQSHRDVKTEAEVGVTWAMSRGPRQPLEAGRGEKTGSLLLPPAQNPANVVVVAQQDQLPALTFRSDLQSCGSCFIPMNLSPGQE